MVKLGSQLQQLGELPEAVTSESEVRNYLKEAEQRQPTVRVSGCATEVTLTCTRGAQGVAEIQVQGPQEEIPAPEMKFDPTSLQRGDSIGHGSFGSVFKAMHPETGMVIAVKDYARSSLRCTGKYLQICAVGERDRLDEQSKETTAVTIDGSIPWMAPEICLASSG
eukprot:Skav206075  [mRNA]  locus=scaffold1771:199708:206759:+ [translate_table: standard]